MSATQPPAPDIWSLSLELPATPDDLWDLMWRPDAQSRWLWPGPPIRLGTGRRCLLNDEHGRWRTGRMLDAAAPSVVKLRLERPATWIAGSASEVTVRIDAAAPGSTVTIEEADVPAKYRAEVEAFWSGCLTRLRALVLRLQERRSRSRQAVVVIHGIGEQRPGVTLKRMIESGVILMSDARSWVKPDPILRSFELRRVEFEESNLTDTPATDFFEFYWAHLIRDTTPGQVAAFASRLFLKPSIPKPLQPLAFVVVLVAVLLVLVGFLGLVRTSPTLIGGSVGIAILGAAAAKVLRWVGRPLVAQVLGDAARYLLPLPENIASRQAIREAGVELIERLHSSGRFDRIVIVGHSLGSVIAYDIITNAWIRMNVQHRRPRIARFDEVAELEDEMRKAAVDVGQASRAQHAAWRRQRANTQPWLITDLITVGSPLTYADFLMVKDESELEALKRDRTSPACPPVTETEWTSGRERCSYERSYTDAYGVENKRFTVFNHAAPFAVTRWTNLYFKADRFGLRGDLVGGPVAPKFGRWVRDVQMTSPTRWVAHTWYWRRPKSPNASAQHLIALRDSMRLQARADLASLRAEIPLFALYRDDAP